MTLKSCQRVQVNTILRPAVFPSRHRDAALTPLQRQEATAARWFDQAYVLARMGQCHGEPASGGAEDSGGTIAVLPDATVTPHQLHPRVGGHG